MKNRVLGLCLCAAVLCCGCGLQRQPAPSKGFLMLDVTADDSLPDIRTAVCLQVRRVNAAAPFSDRSLFYRTGAVTFERDYYNQFLVSPDRQLDGILTEWCGAASVSLCAEAARVDKRLILEPHLEALYGDFRAPQAPTAVAQMRFVLTRYDRACRCSSIVLDRTFQETVSLEPNPSAAQVVEAMSRAMRAVMQRFFAALEQTDF